ncbi:MAG: heavy metal-binding domain-containing protein [Acidimicrobiales bacterium]
MSQVGRHPADLALDALRGTHGDAHPAVTSLSVDEAILLDQVGYDPVDLLTGASVVQVAAFAGLGVGYSDNAELPQLSSALEASRERALDRLRDSAARAGADGVLGVALDIGDLSRSGRLVHLVATGTGVRRRGSGGAGGRPFSAALSGQEVHLLDRAGYQPLGIVTGVCAYHVGRQAFGQWASSVRTNQEMTIYTEALYGARELAMTRLQDRALALGADGVVGARIDERSGAWGTHVIEFSAIGTAVRSVSPDGAHRRLEPKLVIDLASR